MTPHWPPKAKPHLYQRQPEPTAPPIKHTLKVGDFVKVIGEYHRYGGEYTWVDELYDDGSYSVGCPSVGYQVCDQAELRLLHRETRRERKARIRKETLYAVFRIFRLRRQTWLAALCRWDTLAWQRAERTKGDAWLARAAALGSLCLRRPMQRSKPPSSRNSPSPIIG